MAMIDYGALVFKDGQFINQNEFFMTMEKAVGWVDYPFIRYPDCGYIDYDRSKCDGCPRAHFEIKTFEGEEYKSYTTDCQDNPINRANAGIDVINGNYYAYIGNKHFTLAFYKQKMAICIDGKLKEEIWMHFNEKTQNKKSVHLTIEGYTIDIKDIAEGSIFDTHVSIDGSHYHVIFGYGIDPDMKVWNRVKVQYLGKKFSKKIDNLINRYWTKK